MPIRIRLTLAFALAMAAMLAAVGAFLYARLGASLDTAINDGLRSRSAAVAALVQQADNGLSTTNGRFGEPDQLFAQVLDARAHVFDETPGLNHRPLLSPNQLARSRRASLLVGSTLDETPVRLFATPVLAQDQHLIVVVGASLDGRQNALAGLRKQLLVGGPIALLLASLGGYLLAAAALRPVERMRQRAAAISANETGQRLPLSAHRDELTRLGETLNEMLARLELALERERTFVSDASHELRTPLALLKAEIELALEEPRSATALTAALRSAGEETDRLAQLADNLLLLARADKDALPLRREPVEPAALFKTIATRFGPRAHEAKRRITIGSTQDTTVFADRLQLEQALGNLVDNALRHGAGTIQLTAREQNGNTELHVTDEGNGFPPAFLEHAFDRFSRADEARSRRGTGLGLSIVSAIAKTHGGSAHATNRTQGGADAWLLLRARGEQSQFSADPTSSKVPISSNAEQQQHRSVEG